MSKDLCVLCGKETQYEFETHVDYRTGYIEGAGQLCESCYETSNDREGIIIPKSLIKRYSNNYDLGEAVRRYYFENYEEDKKKVEPKTEMVCSYCGKDTSDVDYDYLVGRNHLECVLSNPEI